MPLFTKLDFLSVPRNSGANLLNSVVCTVDGGVLEYNGNVTRTMMLLTAAQIVTLKLNEWSTNTWHIQFNPNHRDRH